MHTLTTSTKSHVFEWGEREEREMKGRKKEGDEEKEEGGREREREVSHS